VFELFEMWALVEIIGLIFLPLTTTVFSHVPDRGWAWSKALGLAVLAICIWLPLMVLHFLTFDRLFIAGILLFLLALNVIALPRTYRTIVQILKANTVYIVITECVFLAMVFVLGYIRSYDPDIHSFEMFMDEGFLASILRSPHFPPHDMWYAGMSINYYYYMHYIVAMLAKFLGQPANIAFNTGISMLYGLTAVSLFGLTANLVSWSRRFARSITAKQTEISEATNGAMAIQEPIYASRRGLNRGIRFGLLTTIMALVLGNMDSAFAYFYRPQQNWYDWFGPSRVIKDTVNEFPAFSFLLSDFHAHTLTLAFTALAMGFALNFFLAQDGRGIWLYGHGVRLVVTLFSSAVVLGGLFIMNSWDFPTYLGLAILCIMLQQWLQHECKLSFKLLLDICLAVVPLVVLAYALFLPFYRHYVSPTSGIGLVQAQTRSTLHDELLIYGLFAFIFISLLICCALMKPKSQVVNTDTVPEKNNEEAAPLLQEASDLPADKQLRLEQPNQGPYLSWPLIGMLCGGGFLVVGLAMNVFYPPNATVFMALGFTIIGATLALRHKDDRGLAFTLLLGTLACALITGCEIFFVRDAFVDQPRYNTVFKFYIQAWILLSVACGAGLYFILEYMHSWKGFSQLVTAFQWSGKVVWSLCLIALLALGAVYPIVAPYYRVMRYNPQTGTVGVYRSNSLDGMAYFKYDQNHLGDYEAIQWLNQHVPDDSVIVEAFYNQDYSEFGRVSAFTGLQTIMGWLGHEYQWRMGWYAQSASNVENFNRRQQDVDTIYTSNNPQQVLNTMKRYNAQYLYVGLLEEAHYNKSNLRRYQSYMQVVYQSDNVTIYKVR
jgi:Chlor_Arch_YYY domain